LDTQPKNLNIIPVTESVLNPCKNCKAYVIKYWPCKNFPCSLLSSFLVLDLQGPEAVNIKLRKERKKELMVPVAAVRRPS
jgi:hypothetical protein